MAMHPNSLANLKRGKRFGEGQPTDHGGAVQGKRLSTYIQEIANETIMAEDLEGNRYAMSAAKAAALALYARAIQNRDVKAIEVIFRHLHAADSAADNPQNNTLTPAAQFILQQAGILDKEGNIVVYERSSILLDD